MVVVFVLPNLGKIQNFSNDKINNRKINLKATYLRTSI